jgi:hypothetical protein
MTECTHLLGKIRRAVNRQELVLLPFFQHHPNNQEEQQTSLDAGVDCGPFVNMIQQDQTEVFALYNKKLRRLLMDEEDFYLGSNYNGNISKRIGDCLIDQL